MIKCAFIFIADGANPETDRSVVNTPSVKLATIGVKDYKTAVALTKELVNDGYNAIELCGGFGHIGVAEIARAAEGKAAVGAVRFDCHPGLDCKSGVSVF